MFKQITAAALMVAGVSAHGHLSVPEPRPLGDAMKTACGTQVWDQMSSDPNGNIQTMAQVGTSQSDFDATACHLWQCRGYQFGDATTSTIHSYSAGEVIPVTVVIAAPHTGVANVSIINLADNTVVGDALANWDVYASTATGVTANETSFSITMPDTLPDACSTSGGCAIQWWWDARSIDQTYMSCVDFTFSGSTSGSSSSGSSAAASSSVATSSAAVASTAAAQIATSSSTSAPAAAATTQAPTTLATSVVPTSSEPAAAATATPSSSDDGSTTTCTKKRKARRAALAAAARRN